MAVSTVCVIRVYQVKTVVVNRKTKQYHAVMIERGKIDTHSTHIHEKQNNTTLF